MTEAGGGLVKRTPQQVQAANLMILQRKDEAVSEILATATYVVIYAFEPSTKHWERKEIEGSLFIVKRSFGVRFRLVVLNRINPKDLEVDLTGAFTFEIMDPYLLYRTTEGAAAGKETQAIWFHNEKDKANIVGCLRKVLKLQSTSDQQQQQEQQKELLLTSSMLPASPSPSVTNAEELMESSGGVSTNTNMGASVGGSASTTCGGKAKPTSIEELLLKAASLGGSGGGSGGGGGGSKKKGDTSTSGTATAPASGQQANVNVMDMLLRPQTLGGGATGGGGGGGGDASTTAAARASRTGSAGNGTAPALLNPLGLTKSLGGTSSGAGAVANGGGATRKGSLPSPWDKQQLKQALLSLIEDDDAFLDTLHRAYLKKQQQQGK